MNIIYAISTHAPTSTFQPNTTHLTSPLDTILRQQPIPSYANQILDFGTVTGLSHGS